MKWKGPRWFSRTAWRISDMHVLKQELVAMINQKSLAVNYSRHSQRLCLYVHFQKVFILFNSCLISIAGYIQRIPHCGGKRKSWSLNAYMFQITRSSQRAEFRRRMTRYNTVQSMQESEKRHIDPAPLYEKTTGGLFNTTNVCRMISSIFGRSSTSLTGESEVLDPRIPTM